MKRLMHLLLLLATVHLSGCAVIAAASAVPGVLVDSLGFQLRSEVETFPRNIEPTAAAAQKSLQDMMLYANALEIQGDGYNIAFGTRELRGIITLQEKTPRLTTMHVKVQGRTRDSSVERAIIESVRSNLAGMDSEECFSLQNYGKLRNRPFAQAASPGWYRRDADIGAKRHNNSSWFRLKLPSGKNAYFSENTAAETLLGL